MTLSDARQESPPIRPSSPNGRLVERMPLGELMRPLAAPGDQLEPGVARAVAAQREVRLPLYARRGKRILDLALIVGCAPLALLISIPIALVNLAIHRDPRQILFAQDRIGRGGRLFRILKFRTMVGTQRGNYDSWSNGHDQLRVTKFGRFLRNSHLDELPQLINVMRGDMSIIGPRPEMVEIEAWAVREVPGFGVRLAVKPGITGYAQVVQGYTGRDVQAYTEKLEHGVTYLRSMSFGLDLWILWRTAVTMLKLDGWRWDDRIRGTHDESAARGLETPDRPRD